MRKENKLKIFPKYSSSFIYIGAIALAIFGSFMIISAEMGESTADLDVITGALFKQLFLVFVGVVVLSIASNIEFLNLNIHIYWVGYFIILFLLFFTRAFAPVGGAYGWIRLGIFSFQPSEIAKVYVILLASKLFENESVKYNLIRFQKYSLAVLAYVFVIVVIQNDFGSGLVLFAISVICLLIPPYNQYQKYQNRIILLIIVFIIFAVIILSSWGTKLLATLGDSYRIKRFLSSADPFAYQYDFGYHLVMSLISFATGGLFGLGYGKSIHKYMNFPNPSTDFILPVIIEENGILFGLLPILIFYSFIIFPLIYYSIKCKSIRSKIVMSGSLMYFLFHFILNVGGVSGLIPLTGVPLLLISSGGTSLVSSLAALGFAQREIINYQKSITNENSSR